MRGFVPRHSPYFQIGLSDFFYNLETVKRNLNIICYKIVVIKNVYDNIIKVSSKTFLKPIPLRVFQSVMNLIFSN